jgi:hypothetical protein
MCIGFKQVNDFYNLKKEKFIPGLLNLRNKYAGKFNPEKNKKNLRQAC